MEWMLALVSPTCATMLTKYPRPLRRLLLRLCGNELISTSMIVESQMPRVSEDFDS